MAIGQSAKFKVSADRESASCKIRCEGKGNAERLHAYLASKFPTLKASAPENIQDTRLFRFDVQFNAAVTPFALWKALVEYPGVLWVRLFQVRIAEQPHYQLQAFNLASWLEAQGEEAWWTVDGDPLLMSRLSFPCPPDELARLLNRIGKPLLVLDPTGSGHGEEVTPQDLNRLTLSDDWGNRKLILCWQGAETDWELVEDEPISDTSTDAWNR